MMNSVFVPNVFGFNADEVKVLMEKYFGEVSDIDLILNSKGEWQAFVHFKCWYDREIVYKAIKTMDQGKAWKLRVPEKDTLVMLKNFSRKEVKAELDAETKREILLKILHPTESPISEHSGGKAPRVAKDYQMRLVDIKYVEKIEKELQIARRRIAELERYTSIFPEEQIRKLDEAKTEYDRMYNQVPMYRSKIESPRSPDNPPPILESETYKEQMLIADREEQSRKRKEKHITKLLEKVGEKLEKIITREEGEVEEDNVSTCVHYPDTPEVHDEVANEVKILSLQHPDATNVTKEKYDKESQCWY
jgi:hypothetical protein